MRAAVSRRSMPGSGRTSRRSGLHLRRAGHWPQGKSPSACKDALPPEPTAHSGCLPDRCGLRTGRPDTRRSWCAILQSGRSASAVKAPSRAQSSVFSASSLLARSTGGWSAQATANVVSEPGVAEIMFTCSTPPSALYAGIWLSSAPVGICTLKPSGLRSKGCHSICAG